MSRVACIIPARGGSVRVPFKNIKPFFGRPIIDYAIENAQRSGLFDEVIVSTDSVEIAAVARASGAQIHWRENDDGTRGTQEIAGDVLRRTHRRARFGLACVLYATTPLLNWRDLHAGWQAMHRPGVMYAFSASAHDDRDIGGFYWGVGSAFIDGLPLARPQDNDGLYRSLRYTALVPIPSARAIDINTLDDWAQAERMYAELKLRSDSEEVRQGRMTQGEFIARNDL